MHSSDVPNSGSELKITGGGVTVMDVRGFSIAAFFFASQYNYYLQYHSLEVPAAEHEALSLERFLSLVNPWTK